MLKDNKILIHGGGLFAGAAVLATVLHSEGVVCIDTRLMCAPPPLYISDLPSNEGQPNPSEGKPLTITAVTTASSSFSGMGPTIDPRG